MSKETQKVEVVKNEYYWVKPFKGEDFEPAKARDYHRNGTLYFCFTNGSHMEVKRAFDYIPLNPQP
jgi:hypothetical protein